MPRHPYNPSLLAVVRACHRRLGTLIKQWNSAPPPRAEHRIAAVANALLRVLWNGNPKSPKK